MNEAWKNRALATLVLKAAPVAALSLISAGCFLGPKRTVANLPQPPQMALTKPAPVLTLPPTITPIETPIEAAPVPVAKVEEEIVPPPVTPPTEEPKKPAPRRNTATRQAPPPAAAPTPAPAPATESAAVAEPMPQLREILTNERRAQYESEFSQSVARARTALGQVAARKNLDAPQRENVSRIETFLAQAEAAKQNDLGTALQLARRADLLGQDLLKSLLP